MKRASDTDSYGDIRILKPGDLHGDSIQAYYCRDCSCIELYKNPSINEPWRLPKEEQITPSEKVPQQEEEQPSTLRRLER